MRIFFRSKTHKIGDLQASKNYFKEGAQKAFKTLEGWAKSGQPKFSEDNQH